MLILKILIKFIWRCSEIDELVKLKNLLYFFLINLGERLRKSWRLLVKMPFLLCLWIGDHNIPLRKKKLVYIFCLFWNSAWGDSKDEWVVIQPGKNKGSSNATCNLSALHYIDSKTYRLKRNVLKFWSFFQKKRMHIIEAKRKITGKDSNTFK